MTRAMPLIPTTVCGSHGLPSWIHLVREAAQADRLGPIDLQEAYEDAVRLAIRDQVEAGVDVISDGEMRRVTFIRGFYDRLQGIRALPVPRRLGPPNYVMTAGKHRVLKGEARPMVSALNATLEGVRAKVALHVCFGNAHNNSFATPRRYRPLFPALLDARVQQFVFEYANREMSELELWSEFPTDAEVAGGGVDVKACRVETRAEGAERAPPDRRPGPA